MKQIIGAFARNTVFANIILATVVVVGIMTMKRRMILVNLHHYLCFVVYRLHPMDHMCVGRMQL